MNKSQELMRLLSACSSQWGALAQVCEASSYSDEELLEIWSKARPYGANDPAVFRMDDYGAIICWDKYGTIGHKYGWQVDHQQASKDGGPDVMQNYRPLYWRNNLARNQIRSPKRFWAFDLKTKLNIRKVFFDD